MPHTARARKSVAVYLLQQPNEALRRRLAILKATPYPPGSRSLRTDADWQALSSRFPGLDAFIYGTSVDALVYTYDATRQLVVIELAIVDGEILPR
jgi:hypothetical protein